MLDIRMFLFEKLSDETMYSVYDLFVLLAELMNESIEDTDFYGFNIKEIEKSWQKTMRSINLLNEEEMEQCLKVLKIPI